MSNASTAQEEARSFTYEELEVGQRCDIRRQLTAADIDAFAEASGDHNPLHLDAEFARAAGYPDRIAHGMLLASWISAALAQRLPGRGTVYLRQSLEFRQAALPGDALCISLEIAEKKRRGRVIVNCRVLHDGDGRDLVRGTAEVIAPQ